MNEDRESDKDGRCKSKSPGSSVQQAMQSTLEATLNDYPGYSKHQQSTTADSRTAIKRLIFQGYSLSFTSPHLKRKCHSTHIK